MVVLSVIHKSGLISAGKTIVVLSLASLALSSCVVLVKVKKVEAPARPAVEPIEPVMGAWEGCYRLNDGSQSDAVVAQVMALGNGAYRVNIRQRFDAAQEPLTVLEGVTAGATVQLTGWLQTDQADMIDLQASIEGESFTGAIIINGTDIGTFELHKALRLSPALGAEPPEGAMVLFDGTNLDAWEPTKATADRTVKWKRVEDAVEVVPRTGSIVTKQKFTDFQLHVEFRSPFMPTAREQQRGNSGVYLQGRYEVQVLDTYGRERRDNYCGGIYQVAVPTVNMCAPPGQWQSYDITFRAPRFDDSGEKTENARLTVVHNGVTIHDDIELPQPTGGALDTDVAQPGGIFLQDHSDRVQYRNIWLVEG